MWTEYADEIGYDFPEAVEKYGLETVGEATDAIYYKVESDSAPFSRYIEAAVAVLDLVEGKRK